MKILRTDGGGESFSDERLMILRKTLIYLGIKQIYKLHDYKGMLTVYWLEIPSQQDKTALTKIWGDTFYEYDIEHKLVTFIDL